MNGLVASKKVNVVSIICLDITGKSLWSKNMESRAQNVERSPSYMRDLVWVGPGSTQCSGILRQNTIILLSFGFLLPLIWHFLTKFFFKALNKSPQLYQVYHIFCLLMFELPRDKVLLIFFEKSN